MDKPNMLFIHPQYRYYRAELFAELSKRYNIHFLFIVGKPSGDKIQGGIKYSCIYGSGLHLRDLRFIPFFRLLESLLFRKYDILITSVPGSDVSILSLALARCRRKKTITLAEDWYWPQTTMRQKIRYYLGRFVVKLSNALVPIGEKSTQFFIKLSVPLCRLFPIPVYVLDYGSKTVKNFRKVYNIERKKVVLYLGRLIPIKGVEILIKAFYFLEKKIPDAFLLVVGEGSSKQDCVKLARRLDIKNIMFGKWVYSIAETADYYEACDVLVLPSINLQGWVEAHGHVIPEAMSCSKPIITTDAVGAVPEFVVDGYNGFVVKNDNVEELYSALLKILNNDAFRKSAGVNSRKLFEKKISLEGQLKGFVDAIEFVK